MRVDTPLANLFPHAVQLRHHLIIPKAQHAIAARFQKTCSGLISRPLLRVLSTIEFDNQAQRGTAEIDNIRTYRMLTPEFSTKHLSIS